MSAQRDAGRFGVARRADARAPGGWTVDIGTRLPGRRFYGNGATLSSPARDRVRDRARDRGCHRARDDARRRVTIMPELVPEIVTRRASWAAEHAAIVRGYASRDAPAPPGPAAPPRRPPPRRRRLPRPARVAPARPAGAADARPVRDAEVRRRLRRPRAERRPV